MSSEVKLIEDWRERWEPVTKDGHTVLAVSELDGQLRVWACARYGFVTMGNESLIPKPRPKTFRPWRREEVPVDEWFRRKSNNSAHRIQAITWDGLFHVGGFWYGPKEILDDFVLHRTTESGEWLPVEQCPRCGVKE